MHSVDSVRPIEQSPKIVRRRTWAGIALIIAASVTVYWPSLCGGFIWDDEPYLSQNPMIKAADGLYRYWFTTEPTDYYPFSNTTLWIEWRLWGANPTGYHVTNLLLHIASVLLIWQLLRKLSVPGAFLAALLFAVHPVNVESVAWICQRKGLLALVLSLLSILWYLRDVRRFDIWYWLSLTAFLLAMLSKGSVAVLPIVLLLIAWWQKGRIHVADIARMTPFFFVAIVLTGVNVWFQKHGADIVLRDATLAQRLLGAGAVVWFYLSKALLPLDLIFIYPAWNIHSSALWWLPLAAVVAVTCLLVWQSNSRRGPLGAAAAVRLGVLLHGAVAGSGFCRFRILAIFAGGRSLPAHRPDRRCGTGRRGLERLASTGPSEPSVSRRRCRRRGRRAGGARVATKRTLRGRRYHVSGNAKTKSGLLGAP